MVLRNTQSADQSLRYQQVKAHVIALIQRLHPGDRLPSVRQLVADAGVSHNTVVRAMDDLQREGWVDLEVGRGAFVARAPRPVHGSPQRPGGTVVFAAPEWHSHFIWSVGRQLGLLAMRAGRRVLPWRFHPGTSLDELTAFTATLPDCAGVVVIPTALDVPPAHWRRLAAGGAPVVSLHPTLPGAGIPTVCASPMATGAQLARHLTGLGHRSIAFLQTQPASAITRAMVDGAATACAAVGGNLIPVEGGLADFGDPMALAAHLASGLLERPDRPTAIICTSSEAAVATIRVAVRRGLRVPDDVSILGVHDEPLYAHLAPSLTVSDTDHALLAERALDLISGAASGDQAMPVSIIARESTGPAPLRMDKP